MFNDVVDNMLKFVKFEFNGSGKIRIFDVLFFGWFLCEYIGLEMIGNFFELVELYVEEIFVEEL